MTGRRGKQAPASQDRRQEGRVPAGETDGGGMGRSREQDVAGALQQAIALHQQNRLDEARRGYEVVLRAAPHHFQALNLLGTLACQQRDFAAAVQRLGQALRVDPKYSAGHSNLAYALRALGRHREALASCERALTLMPNFPDALNNRGGILGDLGRHDEALASYDRALALAPATAQLLADRGLALRALDRREEALAAFEQALALAPDHADAQRNRATTLSELGRHEEAAQQLEGLLRLRPDFERVPGDLLQEKLQSCDWQGLEAAVAGLVEGVEAGRPVTAPFSFLCLPVTPADQLRCARLYAAKTAVPVAQQLWKGECYRHKRIKLAYLSADFSNHATSHLLAGLIEAHDRDRFETVALSFGPAAADEYRWRLERSFGRFIDIRSKSDREAAQLLRALEVDIVVDLKGYTWGSRPGILAFRPAPVQVNYLGYPGTMGAAHLDYIIADRHVIPPEERDCYQEKIVYLPDSYQPNDASRRIGSPLADRVAAGLPADGFVFCAFHNSYKIRPPVFAVWMRLLGAVEGSVLWFLDGGAAVRRNLRRAAAEQGVDPTRLVFAPRLPAEAHLARHGLADLLLDTLPCGAHTTASDALWAGLPVLTCLGSSFAGRVAASLLSAIGLPELVTETLADYEALALALARDPSRLAGLRATLAANRLNRPLFDTDRYRRHIESAYTTMWQRAQRGERPASFAVADQDLPFSMP
jgi:protein O-GlcNAc transferase